MIMLTIRPVDKKERNMWNYLEDMEKLFSEESENRLSHFKTDIIDKGDEFMLEAELPGFEKEDIKVDFSENTLTICAEHKESEEDKKGNYVRRERRSGMCCRRFDTANIDTENITASYKNGILEVTLPKMKPELPATKSIAIE